LKKSILLVLVAAAVVIFTSACGGGGGSSSSNSTSSATSTSTSTAGGISSVLIGATLGGTTEGVSPTNLAVGDQVQLFITGLDASNNMFSVPGSNWTTNAPASVATVTSTGLVTAVGASSTTYSLNGRAQDGTAVTGQLMVSAAQALVTGLVRNENSTGVQSVLVQFYNAGGNLLGQAITGPTGQFRANVPSSAKSFTIGIESADPSIGGETIYYRQFAYGGHDYLEGSPSCFTTLPALTSGGTTPLPNDIVLDARISGPPPPPTGCLSG